MNKVRAWLGGGVFFLSVLAYWFRQLLQEVVVDNLLSFFSAASDRMSESYILALLTFAACCLVIALMRLTRTRVRKAKAREARRSALRLKCKLVECCRTSCSEDDSEELPIRQEEYLNAKSMEVGKLLGGDSPNIAVLHVQGSTNSRRFLGKVVARSQLFSRTITPAIGTVFDLSESQGLKRIESGQNGWSVECTDSDSLTSFAYASQHEGEREYLLMRALPEWDNIAVTETPERFNIHALVVLSLSAGRVGDLSDEVDDILIEAGYTILSTTNLEKELKIASEEPISQSTNDTSQATKAN